MSKNNKRKIAIIGPYPPPYGGISVHIQRVLGYLERIKYDYDFYAENRVQDGVSAHYKFYGFKKLACLFKLLSKKYLLIHHHSPDWKIRVILSIYGILDNNVYLQINGASLKDTIENGGIESFLTRKLLKFVNIIADNEDIAQLAQKYSPKSLVVTDAFLPPLCKWDIYEEFIARYGELLQDRNYIISMVGWFVYYKGEDLYGFDIALRALQRFKREVDEDVLLLVSINGVRSEELCRKIKNYIVENNLNNNVLFIYENLPEIWPIYVVSNVFIRPTCTDGCAVSANEARWFETPVIASDCVPRPEEFILFKNRSADELFVKLAKVCDSNNGSKNVGRTIRKVKNKKFKYKLFDDIYKINCGGRK